MSFTYALRLLALLTGVVQSLAVFMQYEYRPNDGGVLVIMATLFMVAEFIDAWQYARQQELQSVYEQAKKNHGRKPPQEEEELTDDE